MDKRSASTASRWTPQADVPVPGALWLVGVGLFGLAAARRRSRG